MSYDQYHILIWSAGDSNTPICSGAGTNALCTPTHCLHVPGLYLQIPENQVRILRRTARETFQQSLPKYIYFLNPEVPPRHPSPGYTFLVLDWVEDFEYKWSEEELQVAAENGIKGLLGIFENVPTQSIKDVWISTIWKGPTIYDDEEEYCYAETLRTVRLCVQASVHVVNTLISQYERGQWMNSVSGHGSVTVVGHGPERDPKIPLLEPKPEFVDAPAPRRRSRQAATQYAIPEGMSRDLWMEKTRAERTSGRAERARRRSKRFEPDPS